MELFGIDIIDWDDFGELFLRFLLNMGVVVTIVRLIYYRATRRRDYLFTYILISAVIFLLCFLLDNVKLELGFALGLFAIFGIIRYRTQQIPIREMTYLFLVIGISVINALVSKKTSYGELFFTNSALIFIAYMLERLSSLKHESRKVVTYEKIELIKPERRAELLADLEERTGLNLNRIEVGRIDFMRDTAKINIYYYEWDNKVNMANEVLEDNLDGD